MRDVKADKLILFNGLLAESSEQLRQRGGSARQLKAQGLSCIVPTLIDYAAFNTAPKNRLNPADSKTMQKESDDLWESFVQGILSARVDPSRTRSIQPGTLEPEDLVRLMNAEELPAIGPIN